MTEQEFVQVAQIGDLSPGEMTMVKLNRDQVLLANVAGTFYAINNMCTHMMGRLAKGFLDDSEVVCPFHSARFSVVTGKALSSPAKDNIQTYEVKISGEEILIRLSVA
jgi:nitrite reductase/ring-hydroxylating ferredoxin subunit